MKKLEDVVSSPSLDVFGKEGGTVRQNHVKSFKGSREEWLVDR